MKTFEEVNKEVTDTYKELLPIAIKMVKPYTEQVDLVISELNSKLGALTNEEIRLNMSKLAISLFSLVEVRDKSEFKKDCATAIYKESLANSITTVKGTQEVKKSTATLETTNENLVNILYSLISNLLKSKIDVVNKMIDTLKNILISRNSEAKLSQVYSKEE